MNHFTKAEEKKLKQLHSQGLSLNEIARQLHRSSSTIGKYSKQLGLSFARARTKNATKAKQADAAALRADLKLRLLHEAVLMLDSLHKPFLLGGLGGKDNSYNEHVMPSPPPAEMRNLMTSVGIALQRSIELEKVDQQSETSVTVIDEYLRTLGIG
ncbi:GcrA family cell cycle regulator [Bifidobacterium aquikefiri]|uniref:GcrA family cell cycle regulator n=1 Tax=Bifidobacterium aquikefiri TaxID=1653207 RepID=UPI0023F3252C|nr:helix-turn-helix domain-containing protein [Bifidobacterium aquikefiri]